MPSGFGFCWPNILASSCQSGWIAKSRIIQANKELVASNVKCFAHINQSSVFLSQVPQILSRPRSSTVYCVRKMED
ncbi:hypothetical protein NC653_025475 [Populus alba x Populus x berolinensis]|uniref:Uncharacterized protein n=1 Tax=Populus alba x Populus x berolinensis TaxID=444605 RepID=A0AAD6QA01_9ROSI|nr:hypothetical protein NC653_025475 [Populus alba x Populus x berolinensis]